MLPDGTVTPEKTISRPETSLLFSAMTKLPLLLLNVRSRNASFVPDLNAPFCGSAPHVSVHFAAPGPANVMSLAAVPMQVNAPQA